MKPDTMIWIDRFIGTLICWVLSLIYGIKKIFIKEKDVKIRKLLFIKPAEMGTSVILYPIIKKAKEMFPGVKIYFLVFEENVEILRVLNMIDEKNIITMRTDSIFVLVKDVLSALIRLRREKIDAVIDLEFFARFTAILSYLSGAKKRVGFYRFFIEGLYRGEFITHKVNYNYNVHTGISFMSLLYALKYPGRDMPLKEQISMDELKIPKLKLTKEAELNIWNKLKSLNPSINSSDKIVVMNPNTSQLIPFRKWPIEYYIGLAKRLIKDYADVYVVITGTKADMPDGKRICNEVRNDRCLDMTGKTSMRELIDLYNVSNVLVSVDSGPAHFAALTNIGIVCIFGPDTPIIFAPLSKNSTCLTSGFVCNPCMSAFNSRRPACKDKVKKCLKSISVDRVYGVVKSYLNK